MSDVVTMIDKGSDGGRDKGIKREWSRGGLYAIESGYVPGLWQTQYNKA